MFQVFDLKEESPDKVLHRVYGNLEKLKLKEDHLAAEILNRLKLIVSSSNLKVFYFHYLTSTVCYL